MNRSLAQLVSFLAICCLLFSCGGRTFKPPSFARVDPTKAVSATHPDQLNETYVRFPMVYAPGLAIEDEWRFNSVFPVIGVDARDPKAEIKKGFAYFKKGAYEETPWGAPLMEAVFPGKGRDLENYLFLMSNMDGSYCLISPLGKVFRREEGYDPQKFEEDIGYRADIFVGLGMTLKEIALTNRHIGLSQSIIQEVTPGTKEWTRFEEDFVGSFTHSYKNGSEVVLTKLDRKDYQRVIQENPGLTRTQRFLKNVVVPIGPSLEMLAFSALSTLATFGFQEAFTDPEITGKYASATITRAEMFDEFQRAFEHQQKGRSPWKKE